MRLGIIEEECVAANYLLSGTTFQYSFDAPGPLAHLDHLACLLLP